MLNLELTVNLKKCKQYLTYNNKCILHKRRKTLTIYFFSLKSLIQLHI